MFDDGEARADEASVCLRKVNVPPMVFLVDVLIFLQRREREVFCCRPKYGT